MDDLSKGAQYVISSSRTKFIGNVSAGHIFWQTQFSLTVNSWLLWVHVRTWLPVFAHSPIVGNPLDACN